MSNAIRCWLLSGTAVLALGAAALPQQALAQQREAQERHHHNNNNNNNNNANAAVADPGPRGGPAAAGGPLPGLSNDEQNFFTAALARFQEVDSVSATIKNENGAGLGPRFNGNSCGQCHAQPAILGAGPVPNPQVALASDAGATNKVPVFITMNGPVREARFVKNPDGTPDGGVHDLFTITGRTDAVGCNIAQPNFTAALNTNNVIFRIPLSTFGDGLVEFVSDAGLASTVAAASSQNSQLGISGVFNRSGNDGTITRFGWKAQNKSLLIFSGEAYNVEQGVTNENFPNEREDDPNCQFNGIPEDETNLVNNFNSVSIASDFSSDIVNFAAAMRLSAGPTPVAATPQTTHGSQVFANIGCAGCHAMSQTTGKVNYTNQSNVPFAPFSDFAIHEMGTGLADGVSQGGADGSQFKSAPLWGVGQRLFLLHDGRTADIVQAIQQHSSQGSEANQVINNFNMLNTSDQQALVMFLRSL